MLCTSCNGEFDTNGVAFKFCPMCGAVIVPEDTRTHEEKMRFIAEKFEDIYDSPIDLCAVIDENFNDDMGRLLKFITTYNASVQVLELKDIALDKLSEEYAKILAGLQYNTFINPEVAKPAVDLLCYGLGIEIEYTPKPTKPPKPAIVPVINLDDFVIERRVLTQYKGNDTVVAIPDSVSYIGDSVFRDYTCLTKVIVPDSVTEIGEGAFQGCASLTEINIPKSVTNIALSSFQDCTSLTEVTIPNSVTSISDTAFQGYKNLTKINIPDSVTRIGNGSFKGCTSLTEVTIPKSVTNIGSYAFQSCTSLTNIKISNSVTSIQYFGFVGGMATAAVGAIPGVGIGRVVAEVALGMQKAQYIDADLRIGNDAFIDCTNLSQETKMKLRTLSGNYNIVP